MLTKIDIAQKTNSMIMAYENPKYSEIGHFIFKFSLETRKMVKKTLKINKRFLHKCPQ